MLKEAPPPRPPVQPIPAELLKELYLELLEVKNFRLESIRADQAASQMEANYDAKLRGVFAQRGVNPEEWGVNLKTGAMTKKPLDKRGKVGP
jgi:hypothetical protein